MLPLLRMLDFRGLSLSDAGGADFRALADAARRCVCCADRTACIRWLKWRGRYAPAPPCPNALYIEELRERRTPD